jgi:hypothetical protein
VTCAHWLFSAATILAVGLVLSACSLFFVTPPPADSRRGERVDCTTSPAAPIADTLLSASTLVGSLYFEDRAGSKPTSAQNAIFTAGVVWTIVFGFEAFYGYRNTAKCRALVREE